MRTRTAIVCAAALAILLPATTEAATKRVAVPEIGSPTPVAVMTGNGKIHIEAKPRANEGLLAFAKRLCGNSKHSSALSRANGGVRRLKRGVRYRVPFDLLPKGSRQAAIRALLPKDQATADGWKHRVSSSSRGRDAESLWSIAEWFTGAGENHRVLRQTNSLTSNVIRPGQFILVPRRVLAEPFTGMLPAPTPRTAAIRSSTEATPFVSYGSDEQGEYASYRLKAGEALYSSVVMRFTGRLHAADVNELVREIKQRNEIGNVRELPVGYEVEIPLDLLSARYLPPDHPRRVEWEAQRAAGEQIENEVLALDLDGVTVVLDAGHGGRDIGAPVGGLWESNYVYDIMLRTKKLLESRTAATVVPTTREGSTFRIADSRRAAAIPWPRRTHESALPDRQRRRGNELPLVPRELALPAAAEGRRRARPGDLRLDSRRLAAPLPAGGHGLHPGIGRHHRQLRQERRALHVPPGSQS